MNRHLLRLIWNRKRHNLLLSVEIFLSFIVILGVTATALNVGINWFRPLGYRIDNLWQVEVVNLTNDATTAPAIVKEIYRVLRALPGVEAAAGVALPPYESGDWGRTHKLNDGRQISMGANAADDQFAELVGLQVVDGRWFNREDGAFDDRMRSVVINRELAAQLFGDESAVGKILPIPRRTDVTGFTPPAERVVGVIADYRKGGELATPEPYIFGRIDLERLDRERAYFPSAIVIRVAPETTADFEETILNALQPRARGWAFTVRPLDHERRDSIRSYSLIFAIFATIALFLLIMVALGQIGVEWQMVTERTREFGLRRAKGAAAVNIQHQVLKELVLIASLAVVPGVLLAVQIPALPMPRDWVFPDGVFLAAVAISAAVIYLVVLACGWYPSRMATRVHPAEALHYE